MRIKLFFIAWLTLGQATAQPAKQNQKALTLFLVNGKTVSTEEFTYLYRKHHPKKTDYTEAKVNEYLDLLVTFKTKVAEATALGYDTTASFTKEFRSYREELKKPYQAGKDQLDRLTREAYERMAVEVRCSHILVSLRANASPADTVAALTKAMALRERILQGEDFAQVARQSTDDQSSKSNGGDLGYFTALQMVYLFEQAAYSLKTGELSNPVRTRFGFHIIMRPPFHIHNT